MSCLVAMDLQPAKKKKKNKLGLKARLQRKKAAAEAAAVTAVDPAKLEELRSQKEEPTEDHQQKKKRKASDDAKTADAGAEEAGKKSKNAPLTIEHEQNGDAQANGGARSADGIQSSRRFDELALSELTQNAIRYAHTRPDAAIQASHSRWTACLWCAETWASRP